MVLAGGRSRRMGKDKALLPMADGQPLLLKTVQSARSLTSNVIVVTPWPARYQALLPDTVTFVKEPLPPATPSESAISAGPLSGFTYGWQAVSSDWCLLLACDLPYLDPAVMQRWWSWLQEELISKELVRKTLADQSKDSPLPMASLTSGKRGWEPLCGYYHRRCIPSLVQYLDSGQKSFQSWLSKVPILSYQSVPKRMLFNCNTPTDWVIVSPPSSRG